MTDEKKKPEDEISDEQLEEVAGGIIDVETRTKVTKPLEKDLPPIDLGSGGEDR